MEKNKMKRIIKKLKKEIEIIESKYTHETHIKNKENMLKSFNMVVKYLEHKENIKKEKIQEIKEMEKKEMEKKEKDDITSMVNELNITIKKYIKNKEEL
jgi:hypothetical protein